MLAKGSSARFRTCGFLTRFSDDSATYLPATTPYLIERSNVIKYHRYPITCYCTVKHDTVNDDQHPFVIYTRLSLKPSTSPHEETKYSHTSLSFATRAASFLLDHTQTSL